MPVLLHLSASPSGAASHSRKTGQALVCGLQEGGGLHVIERDLARFPPPYPDQAFVGASLKAQADRNAADLAALSLSETLITEVETADLVVIDTPMHNFTVPSVLKTWVDYVLRPGRTFRSTATGKVGLLRDRPSFIIIACGGPFSDPTVGQMDFLSPYLCYVLAAAGIHDVSTLRMENLRRGTAAVEEAEKQAANWIMEQVARWRSLQNCR